MDLRRQAPRSVREPLAGFVHLGRMIDKCRAVLVEQVGEYIYPCPMDRRLLEFVGLSAEQFIEAVRTRTDAQMADWFLDQAVARSSPEIAEWNGAMLNVGPDTEEKWAYFKELRDAVAPDRTDVTSWADLLDLDEGRPVPRRDREA